MPHTLFLTPIGSGVGLTSLALGLVRALDNRGVRVAFFKPIGQISGEAGPERSTHFIRATTGLRPVVPITLEEAEKLIASGRTDELLERIVRDYQTSAQDADVVVIEGLVPTRHQPSTGQLNLELVRALSAEVILAGSLSGQTLQELEDRIEYAAKPYGGVEGDTVIGCIINRAPKPEVPVVGTLAEHIAAQSRFIGKPGFHLISVVPENPELLACRTIDIARYLGADVVHEGEISTRRAKTISLLARTVPNMVHTFTAGAILITPSDRSDVFIAIAMAAVNKTPIAGIILTGDSGFDKKILELCRPALNTGLPVLQVPTNSWETTTALGRMNTEVPIDDLERVQRGMDFVAETIDVDWISSKIAIPLESRMSPAAFCFRITEQARRANKRIILPEGDEPRTVRAAAICAKRGIARCVLLGNPDEVHRVARGQEIELPPEVEIIDPATIRARYIQPLVGLRKNKGLAPETAADWLDDNVMLGTVMLALGEVDGLVSGAVHSSANTIRPALQIIKTKPDARVVSSIFFMCLPDQVLVYGDCAVNPEPDAEALADIAIQSADSAVQFGIPARVALISYSTGESGSGVDVDKVREATRIAKEKRPDLLLDGPLQYDAAAIADVAATKAPTSPVAGRATVFVFPDLNTGNTTYKAVQRSANVVSIGPMLQGLKRPVNDLSRGALVEDIVYTIAITAIQATQV
ncbi:MAG TPA: phosphate acetyltransferase [Chthoniobacterales bacterium]